MIAGYADPSGMTGSTDSWALRGSVRMSSMRRTSIPSFATLHEVNVDDVHLNLLDGQFIHSHSNSMIQLLANELGKMIL